MNNSIVKVLKHSDFQKIWLAQVFTQISLNLLTFGLVLHIFDITGKATSISLVMISSAIPVVIFGPFSGVLADKVDYRKILIYTNFLRFVVAILLLLAGDNILAMLEIIFLINALSIVFTPAESSSIPLIVPRSELISANSAVMITTYATLLVGYSMAGPILNFVGPFYLFSICALLFLLGYLFTHFLSNYDGKKTSKVSIENLASGINRVWKETRVGFTYILNKKDVLNPMIRLTIAWVIFGAFITLLPAYSEQVFQIDPKIAAPMMIGPAGLGMVISALLIGRKKDVSLYKTINTGFILIAISLLIFSLYHFYQNLPLSMLAVIVMVIFLGFGSSMIQIPSQTLLHLNSEKEMRGRVFGLSTMQLRLAISLPALVIAGVSDLTSPLITMIILAVIVFLYSLTVIFEE